MSSAKIKHYLMIAAVIIALWFVYSSFIAPRLGQGKK